MKKSLQHNIAFMFLVGIIAFLACNKTSTDPNSEEWRNTKPLIYGEVAAFMNFDQTFETIGAKLWTADEDGSTVTFAYPVKTNILDVQNGYLHLTKFNTTDSSVVFNIQIENFIEPSQMISTSDGGYLVCGKQYLGKLQTDSTVAVVMKFTKDGILNWKKSFPIQNANTSFRSITLTKQGNLLFIFQKGDLNLLETNQNGEIIGQPVKIINNPSRIITLSDGSYLLNGTIGICKFNMDKTPASQPSSWEYSCVHELSDKTFLVCTNANAFGSKAGGGVSIANTYSMIDTYPALHSRIAEQFFLREKSSDNIYEFDFLPNNEGYIFVGSSSKFGTSPYEQVSAIVKMDTTKTSNSARFYDLRRFKIKDYRHDNAVSIKVIRGNKILVISNNLFNDSSPNLFGTTIRFIWSIHTL